MSLLSNIVRLFLNCLGSKWNKKLNSKTYLFAISIIDKAFINILTSLNRWRWRSGSLIPVFASCLVFFPVKFISGKTGAYNSSKKYRTSLFAKIQTARIYVIRNAPAGNESVAMTTCRSENDEKYIFSWNFTKLKSGKEWFLKWTDTLHEFKFLDDMPFSESVCSIDIWPTR